MRTIYLRATGQTIDVDEDRGVRFMDSAPEPLVEISPDSRSGSEVVPLTVKGSDWLGRGFPDPAPSTSPLSAGELLDAMLESDSNEVLLAVSAWLPVFGARFEKRRLDPILKGFVG
jgi:hypothetical protein